MTTGILCALVAALVFGFLGVTFEVAGKRQYNVWDVLLCKQFVGFLIGLAVAVFAGGVSYSPKLVVLGLIAAASYIAALAAYLTASRERDIAANWTVMNLSVVLPILVSVVWFHDAFTLAKAVGVVLTLSSIVAIGGGFQGAAGPGGMSRWARAIAIAFFFNAWLPILSRFVPAGSEALFTVWFHGLSLPMLVLYKVLREPRWEFGRGLAGISVLAAITHWGGIMLTMLALVYVGRVSSQAGLIVYPITNGLVIPIGVLLGLALLKQRVQRKTAAGVVLGMAGLVFLFLP
jgi:drug/metabolite transporter (DMT)-like permease